MGVMNERGMDISIMKYLDIHTSVSPFKGTYSRLKKLILSNSKVKNIKSFMGKNI